MTKIERTRLLSSVKQADDFARQIGEDPTLSPEGMALVKRMRAGLKLLKVTINAGAKKRA